MWDIFGKNKKKSYKPKKQLKQKTTAQPKNNTTAGLKIDSAQKRQNKTTDNPLKKLDEKPHVSMAPVVNIQAFEDLVTNLKQEMGTVFISAFLADINTPTVYKSWSITNDIAGILSGILINTNLHLSSQNPGKIKSYYVLDLNENKILFTLRLNTQQFAMVLNSKEASIGCLMNIIKPIVEKNITNN